MLTRRVISSLLVTTVVLFVVFFMPNWIYCLLVSLLIAVSLNEFYGIVAKKGILVYKYFGIICGMLYPVVIYLQMGTVGFVHLSPFLVVLACLFTFVLQFTRKEHSRGSVSSISVTMFGLLYIGWFLSFFVNIKFLTNGNALIFFLILVTKSADIGAFFIGRAFGRRSLIPRISPNKTVEGTIGGIATGMSMSLLSKAYLPSFSFYQLVTLGALLSVIGQVGDLAESLLKRDCGVKDSGTTLPGYGGMLDMLDSLLFTTPIFYFYLMVLVQ